MGNADLTALQGSLSKDWPTFAENLGTALLALQEDQFLIVSLKRTGRFIQFAGQGSFGLRCETSSNQFISKTSALNEAQLAELTRLGWIPPTGTLEESTPEMDPDGSPNFHIDCPMPLNCGEIADLAINTLTLALRVPHPGFLEYEAFDSDGNALDLPGLGIKRVMPEVSIDIESMAKTLVSTLQAITGIDDLVFDEDGDIGLTRDDLPVFVRFTGSPPNVRFHTPLLQDVDESPELLSALNELNAIDGLHVLLHNSTLAAFLEIPAAPLVPEHIVIGLQSFCDDVLAIKAWTELRFGGQPFFTTAIPSIIQH